MVKSLEKNNNWWNKFYEEKKNIENLKEVFESIVLVEERGTEESLKKALLLVREIDEKKYKEEIKTFYEKLRELIDKKTGCMNEDINWWDKFYIEKEYDNELKKVFKAIDKADDDGKEESLEKAIKLINELDKDKYKYDIGILNRKIKILEKRLERQVGANFGQMLKSLREQRGLSLARLGDLTGISSSYINRIELGERKAPSYPIIEKLATALSVDVSTLLVAAGLKEKEKEIKTIRELIFSNNFSIVEGEKPLDPDKKQQLIEIIDYISHMGWKENKHTEILDLIELINSYKK